jgi:hypothetical protein
MSPVQALDRFTQIPPFSDVAGGAPSMEGLGKITEGTQIIGENNFHYYVYNYPTANNTKKTMLVGSFPAQQTGKGILVLGQAFRDKTDYDYKSTLFLVDAMAESLTVAANTKRLGSATEDGPTKPTVVNSGATAENSGKKSLAHADNQANDNQQSADKFATDEEISKYCHNLEELLQKKIDQSNDLQDEIKRRKNGKLKVVLEVDIDARGTIDKMEIVEPDSRQRTNDDLVKIVTSASPYKNVPKMQEGLLSLRILFNKSGKLKIESR